MFLVMFKWKVAKKSMEERGKLKKEKTRMRTHTLHINFSHQEIQDVELLKLTNIILFKSISMFMGLTIFHKYS
jgi:hypothetical protein